MTSTHLIRGDGAGGAEEVAALLASVSGRLVTLGPAHPVLRRRFPSIRSLAIPDNDLVAPGDRLDALRRRVEKLRRCRTAAIVAHDDLSHEAAVLSAAAGGPPVARMVHTSKTWTPEDHRRAFHLFAPLTSLYFCVEEKTFQYARSLGLPARRIPQPIDLSRLLPSSSVGTAEGHADLTILFAGRLEWAKGVDILIDAVARLPARISARLWIAGDGPERQNLEESTRRLGIPDRVRFLGHRCDIGILYRLADVSVLPSRSEGLPLAALESLASGTPVLASAVGGLPELLKQYDLGECLIRRPSASKFAEALKRMDVNRARLRAKVRRISPALARYHDARRVAAEAARSVLRAVSR
ncbi:glycosyltransferase [bacterium]|nr:glycosyltransferase [bacterium]